MHPLQVTRQLRLLIIVPAAFLSLLGITAGDAAAACFAPGIANRIARQGTRGITASLSAQDGSSSSGPIVGLWRTVFTANPGTQDEFKFDEGFQQFHADGTELMISRGVPPDLGNVCIGVWERVAGGVIKLRHVTWNWAGQSEFGGSDPFSDAFTNANTGTFALTVTLRVDGQGTHYSGIWEAVSLDLDEKPVSGSEFSGTVRGERLGVNQP